MKPSIFPAMMTRNQHRPTAHAILRAGRVPALLVSNPQNIRYLTGIKASAGHVLITATGFNVYLDSRYLEAGKQAAYFGVQVHPLKTWSQDLKALRKVGVESEKVTIASFLRWQRKFKNTKFVHTSNIIEEFRREKNEEELRYIRHACSMTRALLHWVPSRLKRGVTEQGLAFELSRRAEKLGADGMAFDSIVAFGTHTARPHHQPTARRFRPGDLVQLDIGVKVHGYCSDFSRVFFTGKKLPLQVRAFAVLKRAKRAAEKLVRPGVSNHALDRAARNVLRTEKFDRRFTHALGHGLGLDIHEGVSISRKAPLTTLKRNEVITIEPGVYLEGQWGMRLEDTIIVRGKPVVAASRAAPRALRAKGKR